MATYLFKCKDHGTFEFVRKMEARNDVASCPECRANMSRVFTSNPVHYGSDGFHHTDYGTGSLGIGTKQDNLRRQYENYYGEPAPPPAPDVPKNSREKY